MRVIAVDDEKPALNRLVATIREAEPEAEVIGFPSARSALEYCTEHSCQIVFLDIEMPGINGLELAKQIKREHFDTNIIFVTAFSDYAGEAFEVHASGYLLKPVTKGKVKKELDDLRHPLPGYAGRKVYFQTFGNFEVYLNGTPPVFHYSKTKELLAILVDRRGTLCTNRELMAVLWEDEVRDSYFRNIRADLLNTMPQDIFIRQWGRLGLRTERVGCDYYDWLNGIPSAINAYQGEYMAQYSWGEWTMKALGGGTAGKGEKGR